MLKRVLKHPDLYRESQKNRNKDPGLVDQLMELQKRRNTIQYEYDMLAQMFNRLGKCFKTCLREQKPTPPELIESVRNGEIDPTSLSKNQLVFLNKQIRTDQMAKKNMIGLVTEQMDGLVSGIGNLVDPSVPCSVDEDDSPIVKANEVPAPKVELVPHHEICTRLKMVDTETGIAVAGNRGYYLTGFGYLLSRAIMNYAVDFGLMNGYTPVSPPVVMTKEALTGVCQLSEFEETLYSVGEDKHLIATAEQPLTGMFKNRTVHRKDMPTRLLGISNCFRKETGRHGVDTRGIFRVHQFEKVEQFCITNPEDSAEELDRMVTITSKFFSSLGLGFRVRRMVSGDLNLATRIKYDIEGLFQRSGEYKELASCSNCTDYFPLRLNCRFDDKDYPHMLNATLCPNTRLICCLLEQFQAKDGFHVPEVLIPYLPPGHPTIIPIP